jgi:hypothetical protein
MPLRIENAVDLHCHFHVDSIGGFIAGQEAHQPVPALESAREAVDQGYAAIVLKPHGFASAALAANLERAVGGVRLFGGICTDHPTGGLNVYAIELALALGTRIVWLPTVHSSVDFSPYTAGQHHIDRGLAPIAVIDADGELLPEVHEIAALVRRHDAVLATGHISKAEHEAVVRAFASNTNVVVTHAGERGGPGLTAAEAAELADLGATVEITALACQEVLGVPGKPPEELVAYLATVGPNRCILGTDYGWNGATLPRPVAGYQEFLETLWTIGVPEHELATMASSNPARLLQLPFA